jgi:uncharacterized membrane protein YhhN
MRSVIIIVLYSLTGILYLSLQSWCPAVLEFLLKALIIPLLIALFLVNRKPGCDILQKLLLAALVFSWIGDVLLDIPKSAGDFFIPGLLSFLAAHIMYLALFLKTPGPDLISWKRSYLLLPVVIYGLLLVYYLNPGLGVMRVPVILYSIAILAMLSAAMNRARKVKQLSFYLVLSGAILFLISDSGIAVSRFHHHFQGSSLFIMSTYMLAQLLIVSGYIFQTREKLA